MTKPPPPLGSTAARCSRSSETPCFEIRRGALRPHTHRRTRRAPKHRGEAHPHCRVNWVSIDCMGDRWPCRPSDGGYDSPPSIATTRASPVYELATSHSAVSASSSWLESPLAYSFPLVSNLCSLHNQQTTDPQVDAMRHTH
jgi:hypothetical protein